MKKIGFLVLVLTLTFSLIIGTSASANELIFGLGEEPENLDPHQATGWQEYMLLSFIVEPLFTLDHNYEIVPLLAKDYHVSDDGLEMNIWLKEGIYFHTGDEMTASDVKYSFNRFFDISPQADYLPPGRGGVYEIEIVDDYHVIFHFESPKPLALYYMSAAHRGIMPEGWLKETPEEDIGIRALVGTGPFMFESWAAADRINLKRFDDYSHGPDFISNPGPAKSERMIFRIIPEDATLTAEMVGGGIDVSFDVPPSVMRAISRFEDRLRIDTAPSEGVQYLAMNRNREVFEDDRVRQAIAHGINKEQIAQGAWFGMGEPISGLITENVIGYYSGVEDVEYKHDPELAKELLDQAGWDEIGSDGIRRKDGEKLELELITFSNVDQWRAAGEIIQAQLQELGIGIKLELAEVGATYDRSNRDDWDLGIYRNTWWLGQPFLIFLTHSDNIPDEDGGTNKAHWGNPELDRNLEIAGQSINEQERIQALNEAQRIIVDSANWVPLVARAQIVASQKNVEGIDELLSHPWWPFLMQALLLHK